MLVLGVWWLSDDAQEDFDLKTSFQWEEKAVYENALRERSTRRRACDENRGLTDKTSVTACAIALKIFYE